MVMLPPVDYWEEEKEQLFSLSGTVSKLAGYFFAMGEWLWLINSFRIILCVIFYMLQSKDQKFTFHLEDKWPSFEYLSHHNVKIKGKKPLQMHMKT